MTYQHSEQLYALQFPDEASALAAARQAWPESEELQGAITVAGYDLVKWEVTEALLSAFDLDAPHLIGTYDLGIDTIGTGEPWRTGKMLDVTDEDGFTFPVPEVEASPLFRVNVVLFNAPPDGKGLLAGILANVLIPPDTLARIYPGMKKLGASKPWGLT